MKNKDARKNVEALHRIYNAKGDVKNVQLVVETINDYLDSSDRKGGGLRSRQISESALKLIKELAQ